MDLSVPERVRELLPRVRELVASEIEPLEPRFLTGPFADVEPELVALRPRARELGIWVPQLPEAAGGAGYTLVELAHLAEELGRSPLAHYVANCQAPDAGNMEILWEFGSTEQKRRFLAPLVAGEVRSCFAMTEPERPGSNPVWMDTRARRDGSEWVLDGRKWFTTAADGAGFAVVMAVTDPEAPPHRRASLFLVPTDTPGFRLVRNIPVMGHRGDGWASHGEVELADCRVGDEALLGEVGEGFAIAQARLGPGRIHHCMRWIGVAQRCFDLLCRRALQRELGPGEPLADRQTVRQWIAESRAEIRAARLLVLDAAARVERDGARAASEEISTIKYHVSGVMLRVVDRAIQVHGGLGVTDDTPLAWFYRQERAARIYDGPDEVHKMYVARKILKRYAGAGGPAEEER
ncbi:MAG: acyl-CoA dehydrogenase family protein [Thermoanaerobaculia bacterium]|nr:acyl-CoA dehydrogenase family protein [Thermoanaerobaculia bacterium]